MRFRDVDRAKLRDRSEKHDTVSLKSEQLTALLTRIEQAEVFEYRIGRALGRGILEHPTGDTEP
jgi:hypothetical protein